MICKMGSWAYIIQLRLAESKTIPDKIYIQQNKLGEVKKKHWLNISFFFGIQDAVKVNINSPARLWDHFSQILGCKVGRHTHLYYSYRGIFSIFLVVGRKSSPPSYNTAHGSFPKEPTGIFTGQVCYSCIIKSRIIQKEEMVTPLEITSFHRKTPRSQLHLTVLFKNYVISQHNFTHTKLIFVFIKYCLGLTYLEQI